MARRWNEPTWLYALLCEHYGLLYIGITADLEKRLAQHRASKPWWPEVAHVSARRYPSRMQARFREKKAIWEGRPVYNLEGRYVTEAEFQDMPVRNYDVGPGGLLLVWEKP